MRPKTPLMQKYIQPPDSSSLVSHDEFNGCLIRKVWLCSPSSGSTGNNGPPRAPQITNEASSIIKRRPEEMLKEWP